MTTPVELTDPGGWKAEFDLGDTVYLNGANHGPFPRRTIAAVLEALEWKRDPSRIDDSIYFTLPDRIRAAAAPFFGGEPEEIAVTSGASTGVNVLVQGLDWRPGDHVVVPSGEFPANYLPWMSLRSRGVELTLVEPGGGDDAERIAAALRPTTRVVSVGHVNFASGYRIDLDAVGEICREHDVLFVVDASQSLCAVPVDVESCAAALVTAAGYKWMCSPYGTGLFWIRPELIGRVGVPLVNWESVEGARDFNALTELELDYRPGAARFDMPETAAFLNGMAMATSLEFLGEIGASAIHGHAMVLLDRVLEGLPEGFRADSDLEPGRRSTIVRIVGPGPDATRAAWKRCVDAGIAVSLREDGIRVSPGVWNSAADADRLLEVLAGTGD